MILPNFGKLLLYTWENGDKIKNNMRAKFVNEMSLYKGKNIGYKPDSQLESAESIKFHISKRANGKYFSDTVMKKHLKEDLFWCIEGTREAKEIDYKIPLWSVDAMNQVNSTGSEKNLRLEHAYPRNLLVTYLLDHRDDLTVEEIAELLDLYIHGIVVTLKEDNELLGGPLKTNLPKDLDPSLDPKSMDYIFSRYTTKKIDVIKVKSKKEGKITKLEPVAYFIKDGKIII